MDRERKNIDESTDEWDWVREIPISVPFEEAIIGRRYRIEPTEVLKDALEACESPSWVNYSRKARVIYKEEAEYGSVYCDHERDDLVPTLGLEFYYREFKKVFWVTEDMVTLYEMGGVMTESEENPLQWIIDEPIGIELEPNTLYYFKPHLTIDEIKVFANRIINSGYIKNFLLTMVLDRVYQKGPNRGLKYFVTGDIVNDRVVGWCTGTPVEQSVHFYADLNPTDARKEFGL